MGDDVGGEYAGGPAVQEEECGVGPGREVEEGVVARGEEEDDGEEGEAEGAGTVEDVGSDFGTLGGEPGGGLGGFVAGGGEEDVEGEEDGDVDALAEGGRVAEEEGEGLDLVFADEAGVDEVRLRLLRRTLALVLLASPVPLTGSCQALPNEIVDP